MNQILHTKTSGKSDSTIEFILTGGVRVMLIQHGV